MAVAAALRSVADIESFMIEYYAAWGGADEDRIMSYYADNVTVQIPGSLMQGKTAVREQFVRPFIAAFPGNRHFVKDIIFGRDVAVVEFTFKAEHKGPFAGHAATDARIELPGCGVYEYDSARRQIAAARIYFDVGTLLKQIVEQHRLHARTEEPTAAPTGTIAAPMEHLAFVLDLTELKRAEEALRELESDFAHTNRVSMMGELAASLAHEITQPIASARNNARAAQNFLDMEPPDVGEVKEALGCVVGDVDRARDILERVREHIKKAPPRKERFDLNAAINEVIVLARNAITRNGVSVQTRLADGLLPVHGDRVQLQQVVLNLALNAVEAMGSVEAEPRELLISAEPDHTGVLVAVGDSGPGIDPEHLECVFEAFYTTKSSGVGMGLSICRSIIDAHGGRLWAEANEPRGAVFQFTLPGGSPDAGV